jgi:hypothetical protein
MDQAPRGTESTIRVKMLAGLTKGVGCAFVVQPGIGPFLGLDAGDAVELGELLAFLIKKARLRDSLQLGGRSPTITPSSRKPAWTGGVASRSQ